MKLNTTTMKKKAELNEDSHYMVHAFMRSKLGLSGPQKDIYAIIYGFAKNGEAFTGSRKYLSAWTGSSLSTIDLALAELTEKGYIVKNKCGGKVEYGINVEALPYNSEHKSIIDLYRGVKAV